VTLRIATYNIRKGGRGRRAPIAEVLRALDADVTILQEATDPTVVAWLAEATGSAISISGAGRSVAVLTRVPRAEAHWHAFRTGHAFAGLDLAESGIRILGVHLSAGLSARGERRRGVELDTLLAVAAEAPGPARTLIVGDLNSISPGDIPIRAALPRWIRVLLRVDGGIGTTVVERVLGAGFVDAFRHVNPNEPGATMPAIAPTVRLDYVMAGPELTPSISSCWIGEVDRALLVAASDHLPLVAELDV
jgi:endonuclease/exonuclease/phosphatase family metal-dependent hydrolase